MFPKTQDHTIDRLLGARSGRPDNGPQRCREFDADLANAYVERHLTAGETARYEQHLAACSPCRQAIIALTRMAQTDLAAVRSGAKAAAAGPTRGPARLKQLLGALTAPQWAMAATAVIVLAITLPLILSHRPTQKEQSPAAIQSTPPQSSATSVTPAAGRENAPADALASNTTNAARESNAPIPAAPASDKHAQAVQAKTGAAGAPSETARDDSPAAPAAAKTAEPQPAEATIARADRQTQSGAPATVAQPAAPLPKIDEKEAKKLAKDNDTAEARTIVPGRMDGGERKTENTVRTEEIAPPPVPGSREEDRRARDSVAAGGVPGRPFRPLGESAPAARGASRKVGKHLFWLRDDVWTDKDYNPDKYKPVIIIRDSEVYRELLAKEEKLKPFLTGFPADARVIFIFKGTAYKLVPQDADR